MFKCAHCNYVSIKKYNIQRHTSAIHGDTKIHNPDSIIQNVIKSSEIVVEDNRRGIKIEFS